MMTMITTMMTTITTIKVSKAIQIPRGHIAKQNILPQKLATKSCYCLVLRWRYGVIIGYTKSAFCPVFERNTPVAMRRVPKAVKRVERAAKNGRASTRWAQALVEFKLMREL